MTRYNVYGVSDWPESMGEKFVIFTNLEFSSPAAATAAAHKEYDTNLKIIVEPATP